MGKKIIDAKLNRGRHFIGHVVFEYPTLNKEYPMMKENNHLKECILLTWMLVISRSVDIRLLLAIECSKGLNLSRDKTNRKIENGGVVESAIGNPQFLFFAFSS